MVTFLWLYKYSLRFVFSVTSIFTCFLQFTVHFSAFFFFFPVLQPFLQHTHKSAQPSNITIRLAVTIQFVANMIMLFTCLFKMKLFNQRRNLIKKKEYPSAFKTCRALIRGSHKIACLQSELRDELLPQVAEEMRSGGTSAPSNACLWGSLVMSNLLLCLCGPSSLYFKQKYSFLTSVKPASQCIVVRSCIFPLAAVAGVWLWRVGGPSRLFYPCVVTLCRLIYCIITETRLVAMPVEDGVCVFAYRC